MRHFIHTVRKSACFTHIVPQVHDQPSHGVGRRRRNVVDGFDVSQFWVTYHVACLNRCANCVEGAYDDVALRVRRSSMDSATTYISQSRKRPSLCDLPIPFSFVYTVSRWRWKIRASNSGSNLYMSTTLSLELFQRPLSALLKKSDRAVTMPWWMKSSQRLLGGPDQDLDK